jgi:hypothetical protein
VSIVCLEILAGLLLMHPQWFGGSCDWQVVSDAAQRWLQGGSYFDPAQLNGPYTTVLGSVLYPPTCLWLFVPFSFLPRIVWIGVPLVIMAAALWRLRPAPWGWAVMGLLAVAASTVLMEWTQGNPILWVMAALFASAAWDTPASFVLLKPTLLPFALFRCWHRSWWVGLAILVVLSLPLLALDILWVRVVLDARGHTGPMYSLHEFAWAAIPLVAWASSPGVKWPRRTARPSEKTPEPTAIPETTPAT